MRLLLIICCLSFLGIPSNVKANQFSQTLERQLEEREVNYSQILEQQILPFWQQHVHTSSFLNKQKMNIHYAYAIPENAQTGVVISPGRVEGYLKYQELAFDFYQQGYAVFIIDHQGQGLSDRRLKNPHKGYVENFDDYVNDFTQFVDDIVLTKFSGSLHFVSHSMGGAIGLRYLQTQVHPFKKAVFSSPMWALRSGSVPSSIAKGIITTVATLNSWVSDQSPYFFGGKEYNPVPFEENELTHSKVRYQTFRDIYTKEPKLHLGSVTFDWIEQSMDALDDAFDDLDKIQLPILVMQSGADSVIDNDGQNRFCARLKEVGNPCHSEQPIVILNAKHELFIEQDKHRNKALNLMFNFLKNTK